MIDIPENILQEYYIDDHKSIKEMEQELLIDHRTIRANLIKYGFHIRHHSEDNKYNVTESKLHELYIDKQWSITMIANYYGCRDFIIHHYLHKYGINIRNWSDARKAALNNGRKPGNYKNGVTQNSQGYIFIWKPDYPGSERHGYILEHRYVWEQTRNQKLPDGWVVHHINGIKTDNRPENLIAMPHLSHEKLIPFMAQRIAELEDKIRQLENNRDKD